MSNNSNSIIKKLFKKKAAIAALIVIFVAILLAIFAYPIVPDKTPDANNMVVELSARPSGYKQQFLRVPKALKETPPSYIVQVFTGFPDAFQYVPINSFEIKDNKEVLVNHYIDEGLSDTLSYTFEQLGINNRDELIKQNIIYKRFWLGTDRYGRDILSRLIVGARVSMAVGIVSVILSISIGIFLGVIAGWYRGWVDNVIMWLINILWSIPTLLLVFAITLTLGKGFWEIFIAIGLTSWVSAARLIRGQVLQIKELDYITAARTTGASDFRILYKHVLPNISGPIIVIAAANFATAILTEASLSFLGIGVQPPTPSWGLMIKEHYNFLIAGNPMPALIPGFAIMILVFAFNILGNALRDAIDVRNK